MKNDFLYVEISDNMAKLIRNGVLKAGDRLPSVRMLCREHNISMNTAKRVFLELEAQSLIESKPQSGYFVSRLPYQRLPLPAVSKPSPVSNSKEPAELIGKVYANMGKNNLTLFSVGAPSNELLPLAKLNKEIMHATRELSDSGTGYEQLQGNEKLRRVIAARSLLWGGSLHENDLVTTAGGMNALSFCMMALGKRGDTIAIESPCYPGILQLAGSLGLKVLELPTHPATGIELDALKKAIPKIDLCLLVPNFNTPLGSCMPDEHKKEVVKLLASHGIPLIEDDIYGDLYFGRQRPKCCKSFDQEGTVLWCSSVSKTLAPGYRVGWVAPGIYKEQILKLKLVHAISSPAVTQEAVAGFLKSGRYENHLRKLRHTLESNYQHYIEAIAEYFPAGTKTSRPQGGLALWVEFNKKINTTELFDSAMKQRTSIAPGRMFTMQNQFENCMRLSIGLPWSEEVQLKLKQLGRLVANL
ncbi:aminotransferase-like domain-containing protein [Chitinophaga ginsengisegetis]|uniref:aminotransferase-like domain-containing protein n=1 Tax=Chitinophaga ginsengisegetis TaxID=393003 RepID=UPI000DB97CD8|nr:PLP-dependent aminotransferase family protein [Chitinophaga ginsengisegetis]MDR6567680.1 DNA-binding transcriptional MocR family regulator [Chitinophaga ginsengisegetis]MDR6647765.1 DNA-binding transcriptional MocR family regulator [Chitinophaga ginsengisegetis]MDR6654115.1 DNA-binding transcriptional MocR family regulator [Chitinophaga ginsengisegetis]